MILPLHVGINTLAHLMDHIDMTPAETDLHGIAAQFGGARFVQRICTDCAGAGKRAIQEPTAIGWFIVRCRSCNGHGVISEEVRT